MDSQLAQKSIDLYRDLLAAMEDVSECMGRGDTAKLERALEAHTSLLTRVRETDLELMQTIVPEDQELPLMQERISLMRSVQKNTCHLFDKGAASMALVRSEMQLLRRGKVVVRGYAGSRPASRGLVDQAC